MRDVEMPCMFRSRYESGGPVMAKRSTGRFRVRGIFSFSRLPKRHVLATIFHTADESPLARQSLPGWQVLGAILTREAAHMSFRSWTISYGAVCLCCSCASAQPQSQTIRQRLDRRRDSRCRTAQLRNTTIRVEGQDTPTRLS
jgi:hypothetical protein